MRLIANCSLCQKPLSLVSELKLSDDQIYREYKCGHVFLEQKPVSTIDLSKLTNWKSFDGSKEAFDYQKDGVEFLAANNYNGLIADPMGLGKTIQALLAAKAGGFKQILILVKSATVYQWFQESKEWFSANMWSAFLIQGSKGFIPPGFQVYIMSMDTLSRFIKFDDKFTACDVKEPLASLAFDCVIIDECHSFKNPDSKRSRALVGFLKTADIKHKILLSGTPIKNRADEYFIPLNILRPDIFTSLRRFRQTWLEQDPVSGKYNRVAPYMRAQFDETIKDLVIRREKNAVLSLPPFRRTFERIHIEDENLKAAYNKELAKLQGIADAKENITYWDIQDNLMTLRRITGMAKVSFATEYVDVFLDTTEGEKIAIGVHHEAVRDNLYYAFKERGFNPLKLSGEDSAERKEWIRREFCDNPERRVLIVNILAGGVGLNLQACNNVLTLERQWNAADEEQFEGRFNRQGQKLPVLAEYMIAEGTIDEYFSAMVEKKRLICGDLLDGWEFTSDNNAIRDLVSQTISKKL